MEQHAGVIADGVTERPQADRPRSSKIVAGVSFVLGVGVGVLVATSGAGTEPSTVSEEDSGTVLAVPDPVEEASVYDDGITGVVTDFPDALVAVARTSGSTVDYVLWPIAGDLSIRPMSGGGEVAIDATSQFFAFASDLPDGDTSLLSTGRHNSIRPVATGVTSYAFHDTSTGLLAYTTEENGVTHLATIKSDFDPREALTIPETDVTVVGWGDWGWALQRSSDEIVLLTADGQVKDTEPGVALATHPSAWLIARSGDQLKLVSAGGGVRTLGVEVSLGTPQSASFAPDGSMVAIDGERGLGVLDIGTGELTRITEFSTGPTGWSSDSRFVLASTTSGVLIYDLETHELTPVLREYAVLAVGSLPLTTS